MATTVCLNMIVKDEAHVIERCLASARPLIDTWVIVDTGSTDGTQDVIRRALADLPGELHERPWRDFEHNRNEAMALARGKADYLMIIDADDVFVAEPGFAMPALTAPGYALFHHFAEHSFNRVQIVRSDSDYRYVGVLHEAIESPTAPQAPLLEGLSVRIMSDGARNKDQKRKYQQDAKLLERAVREHPDNTRYQFYLAQSYRDCGQFLKSIKAYQKRVDMGGWDQEVWYALYQIAALTERRTKDFTPALKAYLRAYEFRPQRAEPLWAVAKHYREAGQYHTGYLFAFSAAHTPRPDDILFVDDPLYTWRAADEYAMACFWTGRFERSAKVYRELFDRGVVPESERLRMTNNANYALKELGQPLLPLD